MPQTTAMASSSIRLLPSLPRKMYRLRSFRCPEPPTPAALGATSERRAEECAVWLSGPGCPGVAAGIGGAGSGFSASALSRRFCSRAASLRRLELLAFVMSSKICRESQMTAMVPRREPTRRELEGESQQALVLTAGQRYEAWAERVWHAFDVDLEHTHDPRQWCLMVSGVSSPDREYLRKRPWRR